MKKERLSLMYMIKYLERDGSIVFVPIQTWSQTRKQEFAMREWTNVN